MNARPAHHHAQSISALGLVAMLTTLGAWTASPLLNKFFTEYIDVWNLNGWRYAMAALCWSPLIFWHLKRGTLPKGIWKAALLPATFNAIGQVAFAASFFHTSATTVAFALRVQLIAVAVGGAIFFAGERRVIRDPRFLIGMVLVLGGVGGYLMLDPSFGEGGENTLLGAALGAIGGVFFGAYGLAIRPMMRTTGPLLSYSVISAYTAVTMVVLMLVFSADHGAGAVTNLTPALFGLLIISAIVALVIGHPCYYAAIRSIGVSATAAVLQLQPITVGVSSLLIVLYFDIPSLKTLETHVTPAQWGAGLIAIGAAVWMLRVQHALAKHDHIEAQEQACAQTPEPILDDAMPTRP